MKEGRALNNASEDLRPKKLGRYLSVVMGVASKVLGCVNLPIEMTSAFGIECNFFFRLDDRIYTDRSRKSRAHDIISKSDDAAI